MKDTNNLQQELMAAPDLDRFLSENQDNFPVAKGFGPPQVPQEKRRNTPEKHTRPAARVHCPPPRP